MPRRQAMAIAVICLAASACAVASTTGERSTPGNSTASAEPSCACSYPPTVPPGGITRDAAIAAALRVTPGAGPKTTVVWADSYPDPFVLHDVPSGTPDPVSSRVAWIVRLEGGLTAPPCGGAPVTTPAARDGPCLDDRGGVAVVLDPITGALRGWTH